MRILFVHPSAPMSIGDVGRGYRSALERQGHNIADYSIQGRMAHHIRAAPAGVGNDKISRLASECILNEAMYHKADLVLIISGLNVHPISLWLLGQVGIPAAVVFTESPYDDEFQADWADMNKVQSTVDLTIFTNDRYSAMKNGWHLLPPAYDSLIHRPGIPNPEFACDVLLIGTGWPERQAFLEAVDWNGIDFQVHGIWTGIEEHPESPLHKFYQPGIVDNARISARYASAKICINLHRRDLHALTPGPRVIELAACGAFQISDYRHDMDQMFGSSIPVFDSPVEMERVIRYYLERPEEREKLAAEARYAVRDETFDNRADKLVNILVDRQAKQGAA